MAQTKRLENEWIPLPDGRRLAARIWLPKEAHKTPVPAVLEYLPYPKRADTAMRDESIYPTFAAAGYAGVRVDISGTGESDGDFDDEYSVRELADACHVIEWIASQPWCNGELGMMGISWGGFNSLQVAALKPPALKAIISIGSTVDRYNDDIHYKNGCLLGSNFSWAAIMLGYTTRPPDPELVGDGWRDQWLHRLETQPFLLETWLSHQRKDDYWKRGSISEDYSSIEIPVLIISGWADGYHNAPPAAAARLKAFTRAINGPWIHNYPHFAWPKPRMDFLGEALNWWDRWLKNADNQVEQLPAYRAFISECVRPQFPHQSEAGRWVTETELPSQQIKHRQYYLAHNRRLLEIPGRSVELPLRSPQNCGLGCGEFFTLKPDAELPGDQRHDDSGSLVFDSGRLYQAIEILGRPRLRIRIAIDQTQGNLAVRLNDLHPDGVCQRVSWGVLNLAHRQGNVNPQAMIPGQMETIEIELDECGYRFLPGHRMRVSISTSYWPMIMPPPVATTAHIKLGAETYIDLPLRFGGDQIEVKQPEDPDPLPSLKKHLAGESRRWIEHQLQDEETHYHLIEDSGENEFPEHRLRVRHRKEQTWSIAANDPLSCRAKCQYTCWMRRKDWSIRTESVCYLRCDANNFYIDATVTAFESEQQIHQRHWQKTIAREFI